MQEDTERERECGSERASKIFENQISELQTHAYNYTSKMKPVTV